MKKETIVTESGPVDTDPVSRARELASGGTFRRVRHSRQQRIHTHNKIVNAARRAFKEKKFHYTTVDDIVSGADISRATFYTFFRGKEEVLLEIVLAEAAETGPRYKKMVSEPIVDQQYLATFILDTIRWFRDRREWLMSFYVVCDIFEEMPNFISGLRDEYIQILGQRFPAFRIPDDGSEAAERRRCEAHLLMYEIEQFSLHAAFPGWKLDVKQGANLLAEHFLAFLESVPHAALRLE